MAANAGLGVRLKGFANQLRAQVGAADTDAYHIGERLAGVPGAVLAQHLLHQGFHLLQGALHLGDHVFAVNGDGVGSRVSQCRVKGGAIFGNVDSLSAEQGLPPCFQVTAAGQCQKRVEHVVSDPILGKIQ